MSKFGKCVLLTTGLGFLAPLAQIPGAITKVHAKDQVCSVASLKGRYAFRRTGFNNLAGGATCTGFGDCGPIAEIGVSFFSGDGKRGAIRTTRSTSGEIRPWGDQPAPNGHYTVDSDCTGSFFDEDGTHSNDVVVFDGGKRFFVLSQVPSTIVTEEAVRLDDDRD